jgi:hypothetical protein
MLNDLLQLRRRPFQRRPRRLQVIEAVINSVCSVYNGINESHSGGYNMAFRALIRFCRMARPGYKAITMRYDFHMRSALARLDCANILI